MGMCVCELAALISKFVQIFLNLLILFFDGDARVSCG